MENLAAALLPHAGGLDIDTVFNNRATVGAAALAVSVFGFVVFSAVDLAAITVLGRLAVDLNEEGAAIDFDLTTGERRRAVHDQACDDQQV